MTTDSVTGYRTCRGCGKLPGALANLRTDVTAQSAADGVTQIRRACVTAARIIGAWRVGLTLHHDRRRSVVRAVAGLNETTMHVHHHIE